MTRLVLVTGAGPEHRFVANAIAGALEVEAILVTDPAPRRGWKTVLRKHPTRFLDKAALKLFDLLTKAAERRRRALDEVLGPNSREFAQPGLLEHVGRPKDGGLEQAVRSLHPDILAIYGTAMIPDTVLRLPGRIALNMHTGLSPDYRGTACAFWPIQRNEPDRLGATVHECTAEVDGGDIFARARSGVQPGDSLDHVFARAVVAGAGIYVDVLRKAVSGELEGTPQDLTQGHVFKGIDRGLIAELIARRNLARMSRID